MTLIELIAAAKAKTGTLMAVADRLKVSPARISDWKKGTYKPSATVIIQLAEIAELPPITTLGEVEAQLHPEASAVWQRALGKMRAAGVTASVAMLAWSALTTAHSLYSGLCIM